MTTIRMISAGESDMEMVAKMIRSSADWYADFVSPDDLAEHYVDKDWQQRNYRLRDFYMGYDGAQAVGTISLQYFGDYAYIGYLYLDTRFVGKGYGRAFLDFAVRQARRRGMKGIVLIAHPDATWAVKAYSRYGFERIADNRRAILTWNQGALKPYYEEGFDLYLYSLTARPAQALALAGRG